MYPKEVSSYKSFGQLFGEYTEIGELVFFDHNLRLTDFWSRPENTHTIAQETYQKNVLTGRVIESLIGSEHFILLTKKI